MIDENVLISVFEILKTKCPEEEDSFWDQAIDIVRSVVPEPQSKNKTGLWYDIMKASYPPQYIQECSECGCQFDYNQIWKYCPVCGSRNNRN